MPLRRTHVWGEARFSWGSSVLAPGDSHDGARVFAVYADGAVVEWNAGTGSVGRILARGEPAIAAAFDPRVETALVLREWKPGVGHEIVRIDLSTGSADLHTRKVSGARRLWVAPDGASYALGTGSTGGSTRSTAWRTARCSRRRGGRSDGWRSGPTSSA